MKLKPYPKYKMSGVKWLGDVPEGWEIKRLKFLFKVEKRIAGEEGYDVLSVTQQGIKIKDIESNDGQLSMDYSKYQFVNVGDFVMNHMDLLTGYVDISKYFGVTSPDYRVFSIINPKISSPKYNLFLFQLCYHLKIFYGFGQGVSIFGRWRLPSEQFDNFLFPLPPLSEQQAIAAFLDRELSKIDSLLAKKKRLLELLREKRSALISSSVTKGLDPTVKFKPSGVKWLGEVPEHWEITVFKYFCDVRDGTHDTPEYVITDENSFPLITSKDLITGKVLFDEANHISDMDYKAISKRSKVECGDLIMPMIGTVGGAVFVNTNKEFAIKNVALFKKTIKADSRWLMYVINSEITSLQFDLKKTGGVQGFVSLGTLRNLTVILPPFAEQQVIVAFLDRETTKIDALVAKVEAAIEKLTEYRTALISAAVTGKIDVRDSG